MLRLDHWSESLRGLNNPRGRGENDAISDRGVAEVTIASFLIPTTRVFKPRRDSFGGHYCIISHPNHEGFQTEERLVRWSN